MTKDQFLSELERKLKHLPADERADAVEFYREYFEEAGVENEQRVIAELKRVCRKGNDCWKASTKSSKAKLLKRSVVCSASFMCSSDCPALFVCNRPDCLCAICCVGIIFGCIFMYCRCSCNNGILHILWVSACRGISVWRCINFCRHCGVVGFNDKKFSFIYCEKISEEIMITLMILLIMVFVFIVSFVGLVIGGMAAIVGGVFGLIASIFGVFGWIFALAFALAFKFILPILVIFLLYKIFVKTRI